MTNTKREFTGKVAFVADVSQQGNQVTARMIDELGGRALAVRCDVTQAGDVEAALEKTIEAFGRLDVAFNNAGVEQPITPTADITELEWDRIVDINLRGVFLCMKSEIPLMLKQGSGAIVNTSSEAGVKGFAGHVLDSKTVTPIEALHFCLNLPIAVQITGIDSQQILDQALEALRTFRPLTRGQVASLLNRTRSAALEGKYELYKTSTHFDGTQQHPRLDQLTAHFSEEANETVHHLSHALVGRRQDRRSIAERTYAGWRI